MKNIRIFQKAATGTIKTEITVIFTDNLTMAVITECIKDFLNPPLHQAF